MADGSEIPGPPSLSLKDRVRNQARGTITRDTPPHITSNNPAPIMMLRAKSFMQASNLAESSNSGKSRAYIEEVSEDQSEDDETAYAIAEAESMLLRHVEDRRKADEELHRAEDYLAELRTGKKVRFAGVEVPTLRSKLGERLPANVDPANSAARPLAAKQTQSGNLESRTLPAGPTVAALTAEKKNNDFDATKDSSKLGGDKNFRFQTPIELENQNAAEGILRTLLRENITVSVADLLAACPDVRRQLKDKCLNKRVPRTV